MPWPKFRATEEEQELLKGIAKRHGMTVSEYLRAKAFAEQDLNFNFSGKRSSDLKTSDVRIPLTPDEYKEIIEKANKAKIKFNKYIVLSALEKEIIVFEGFKDFTHQLSKVGINLNQIAMLANQGKVTCVDIDSVKKTVNGIWESLNSITAKQKKSKRRDKKNGAENSNKSSFVEQGKQF